MAQNGNSWNELLQTREARIVMYAICAVFCGTHVYSAVMDLLHPENSAMLIESMGLTGFYVMTFVRLVVVLWAGIVFVRMGVKVFQEKDE